MSRFTAICNPVHRRFIPQGVNLRIAVLLTGMVAGVLHGQATTPAQPATPSGTSGSMTGAGPSRANGYPPTEPGLNGGRRSSPTRRGQGSRTAGNGAGNTSQPPAPAATESISVIGQPNGSKTATIDRPLLPMVSPGNALGIASGTPIQVKLRDAVDSGHARNGDMLNGTLAAPIGGLPVGTPVQLTVVSSTRAGQLTSYGELSLQVVSIANRSVLSDTISARGKEGPKELPDAAPARGTEAILTPDQPITLPAA